MSQVPPLVLIVDDSPADRELYRRYLKYDSYRILEADLGQQGLDLYQHHQPDVVLLDYRLPDLDGLEFLAKMRSLSQQSYVPVIVITGQGNEAIAVQSMKAGAQDYLVKEHLNPEMLRVALNSAMTHIKLRQQLQRNETALRESEERFRQLAENIDAVFWLTELPERRVSYVSPAYQRLWGLNPQDVYADAQTWTRLVHSEDRQAAEKAFQEKALEGHFDEEYRIVLPDGRVRWVRDRCFPLYDAAGKAYRLAGIAEDITDHKRTEQALQTSAELFRTSIDNMLDCFAIYRAIRNPQGTIVDFQAEYINDAACRISNLPREKHLTQGLCELLPAHRELGLFDEYCQVVETGQSLVKESVMYEENSDHQRLSRAFDIRVAKFGDGYIATWRDITSRKQLEHERDRLLEKEQAARTEAERANRIKDEFLAILSHELRSPLNPILGWAKLLQLRQFDQAKTAEALATIERNAKLQCQLIDDLLDVAKILRGKLSVETTPVDLVFVIESAIETVRSAALAKSIVLHSALPNIGQVLGDAARLQQIVWNLLSNAIKFTPTGGRVEIRLERQAHEAHIIVSDTGRGINPDFLPHLFETFRQEDVSTTRQFGGLGLGLAIVRHLVEAHGGSISAESQGEGQGATFIVRLPLVSRELEKHQSDEHPSPNLNLGGIRVLMVDDEPDARTLLKTLLSEYGADVLAVTSAAEVLDSLESFQPDVLISDVGMPDMDGYSLLRKVRSLPSDKGGQVPAIALTAYAREVDYQHAMRAGYQRHLPKPVELDALIQAVTTLTQ